VLKYLVMSKIGKNIGLLRGLKKLSQDKLATELDIPRSRLGSYEEGRAEPPYDLLIKIADFFHIAIDAMVRADLSKTDPDALMKIGKNRILFPIIVDKDNNDMLEVVPIKASAGYLNGYGDPSYVEKMPLMKLPFHVTGKHRAFPIKGDSMLPLKSGSYVIGKYVENIDDIKNGNTYVILTKEDGISYKRVFKKGNELELHSDNKEYKPYKVKTSEVLEIWEFVCCLHLSDKKEEEVNMEGVMKMLRGLQVEMERIKK
jgi:transcriptional regulator with XRE-family HTH domain